MDIELVATFYERLAPVVEKLQAGGKMDIPVKEGGWTPKQLIHHLADAQTQAYYRILWLLTEDHTTLKPFDQDSWVAVVSDHPVEASLSLLKGIYSRWYHLLKDLDPSQYERTGMHPETGEVKIGPLVEYYINHGETHFSQFASMVD